MRKIFRKMWILFKAKVYSKLSYWELKRWLANERKWRLFWLNWSEKHMFKALDLMNQVQEA